MNAFTFVCLWVLILIQLDFRSNADCTPVTLENSNKSVYIRARRIESSLIKYLSTLENTLKNGTHSKTEAIDMLLLMANKMLEKEREDAKKTSNFWYFRQGRSQKQNNL